MHNQYHRFSFCSKPVILAFLFSVLSLPPILSYGQVTLLQESFETDGEGSRYSSNTGNNSGDIWARTNLVPHPNHGGTNQISSGGALDGSFYWVAEDLFSLVGGNGFITLLNTANISGYSALNVQIAIAANRQGESTKRWERDDFLKVEYNIDNTGWNLAGFVAGNNPTSTVSTGDLAVDTDNNTGTFGPYGTVVTTSFQDFTFPITGTGSSMQVRVLVKSNGTEELGFDNIRVQGTLSSNTPSVLANIEGSALSYNEGDPATQVSNTITVTDSDDANLTGATVSIFTNFDPSEDVLAFTSTGGITGSFSTITGILSLSGTASVADYQTVLRSVTYQNTDGTAASGATRTIRFQVNDGTDLSNTQSRDINVNTFLNPTPASLPFCEDFETDGEGFRYASNAFKSGCDLAERGMDPTAGGCFFNSVPTTDGSYAFYTEDTRMNGGSFVLTSQAIDISGLGLANFNIDILLGVGRPDLRWEVDDRLLIEYSIDNGPFQIAGAFTGADNSTPTATSLLTQDTDNDPSTFGPFGTAITGTMTNFSFPFTGSGNSLVYRITIQSDGTEELAFDKICVSSTTPSNLPPVLANIESAAVAYSEGDLATQVSNTITATDPDDTDLESATVSIIANFDPTEDVLAFTSTGGITGIYNSTTGVLTLSGTSSIANYQTVLRSVTYENTDGTGASGATRTIRFQVGDGTALSNFQQRDIDITTFLNPTPVALPFCEDFETDGEGFRYASNAFKSGCDFAERGMDPTAGGCFSNSVPTTDGSYAFYTEDTRMNGGGFVLTSQLLDISSLGTADFSIDILLGVGRPDLRWEVDDRLLIEYSIDNGPFQIAGVFTGADNSSPTATSLLTQDTDNDPSTFGPFGTAITGTMANFSFPFTGSGNTIVYRITIQSNGTEELAFDKVCVTGVPFCPVLSNETPDINTCTDDLTQTLSVQSTSADVDIKFVVFNASTADPYSGGTQLGTVVTPTGGPLTATSTTDISTLDLGPGTYFAYAILDTSDPDYPASSSCTPFAEIGIQINQLDTTNVFATTCDPGLVGVVPNLLTNQFGCDSLVITTTALLPADTTNVFATTCDPGLVGVVPNLLTNQFGCDSLVITTTALLPSDTTNVAATTCDPGLVGVVPNLLTNQFGCDSLVITTTALLPADTTNVAATTCDPGLVGVVPNLLTNQFGCDSLVITTTTLLPSDTTNVAATTCDPGLVGVVPNLLTNQFGCDSLVITTTTLLNIPPVANCQDITVYLDASGNASITGADLDGGSTDFCGIASLALSKNDFSCSDIGTQRVWLTVTNTLGLIDTCSAVVTVVDTVSPTAVCQDITVYLNAGRGGTALITGLDVDGGSTDACGIAAYGLDKSSFNCQDIGANTVTLTVSDVNGNSSSCTANITVVDTISPVAICKDIIIQLDAGGNASITSGEVDGGSNDNCGISSILVTPSSFTCSDVGANTVTLIVKDVNGNSSSCTGNVTVENPFAPVASCKDITVKLDENGIAMIEAADIDNGSAATNCGIASMEVFPNMFSCADIGANTVTLTVKDVNGKEASCTATVTVKDDIPPVITCPSDIRTFSGPLVCGKLVYYDRPTAIDNCAINLGDITTNLNDNRDTDGYMFDITATEAITVRSFIGKIDRFSAFGLVNVRVYYTSGSYQGSENNSAAWTLLGTDQILAVNNQRFNADVGPLDIPKGETYGIYITLVDPAGGRNFRMASRRGSNTYTNPDVTINTGVGKVYNFGSTTNNRTWSGTVVYTTAGPGAVRTERIAGPPSLGFFPIGTTTVTYKATDPSGNMAQCSFDVTVVDKIPPLAKCKDITVQLDDNGMASIRPRMLDNGSWDACGIASYRINKRDFTCADVGVNRVRLTVTDNNGNESFCVAKVTVEDKVPPVAICKDITIQLDASGNARIRNRDIDGGSTDACGIDRYRASKRDFTCADVGPNTVTLTVRDNHGNESSCTATVTVEDHVPPVAICQDLTVQLNKDGWAWITPEMIDNGSNDACGIKSLSLDNTSFSCDDVGMNTVTLTVTDNNNNVSTCTAKVTVEDNIPPMAMCKPEVWVRLDKEGNAHITPEWVDNGSSDACGISYMQLSQEVFDCSHVGRRNITLTVVDVNGNSASCETVLNVIDDTPPVAMCKELTLELGSDGKVSITPEMLDNGSNDACGISYMEASKTDFSCADVGEQMVSLKVVDNHGNISTCEARVTIKDHTPPVAMCKNIDLYLDANGYASIKASDVDGGSYDNCGISYMELSQTEFSCSDVGINMVELKVVDHNGLISTCMARVELKDHSPPVVKTKEVIVILDAHGNGSISPSMVNDGSYDACGIWKMELDRMNFDCSELGTQYVSLTVYDNNGNHATEKAKVTIKDQSPPVVITKEAMLSLDENGMAYLSPEMIDGGTSDACGIMKMELDQRVFGCNDLGETYVTLTVYDVHGNRAAAQAKVTIEDQIAPMLSCPADISLECGDDTDPAATGMAEARDNCSVARVDYVDEIIAGDCPNNYIISRTWMVSDMAGNMAECIQIIELKDTQAPALIGIPSSLKVTCENVPPVAEVAAMDGCDGAVEVVFTEEKTGDCANSYTLIRSWSAKDACGNERTAEQVIEVEGASPAFVNPPADLQLACQFVAPNVPPLEPLSWTDACGNSGEVIGSEVFRNNQLIRTWTYGDHDSCSVVISHTQTISFADQIHITASLDNWKDSAESSYAILLPVSPIDATAPADVIGDIQRFVWVDGAKLTIYQDTAYIEGVVQNLALPEVKFDLLLVMTKAYNWSEWSSKGRGYTATAEAAQIVADMEHPFWTYWTLHDELSRMEGTEGISGTLMLTHYPSDTLFGVQQGMGANLKDGDQGIGGMFGYKGVLTYNDNTVELDAMGSFSLDITEVDTLCGAPEVSPFITQFDGFANGADAITLVWNSITEGNEGHVRLEKSIDNIVFVEVETMVGNRLRFDPKDFRYVDNEVGVVETYYYRIKTTKEDGRVVYSKTISFDLAGLEASSILIYPNPVAQGEVFIQPVNPLEGQHFFKITDMSGRELIRGDLNNKHTTKVGINRLSRGSYLIYVYNPALRQVFHQIITKQ